MRAGPGLSPGYVLPGLDPPAPALWAAAGVGLGLSGAVAGWKAA